MTIANNDDDDDACENITNLLQFFCRNEWHKRGKLAL
jgi:hypothetical protein